MAELKPDEESELFELGDIHSIAKAFANYELFQHYPERFADLQDEINRILTTGR